jgi:hypothetical protein
MSDVSVIDITGRDGAQRRHSPFVLRKLSPREELLDTAARNRLHTRMLLDAEDVVIQEATVSLPSFFSAARKVSGPSRNALFA